MQLPRVEYEAKVLLVRELVYAAPDKMGMRTTWVHLDEVWSDIDDAVSVPRAIAKMPDDSWGWFTQERLGADVAHDGEIRQMTSLPFNVSGTTFVGASIVSRLEILRMVQDQQNYVRRLAEAGRPPGPLPHGADKRPILLALEAGESVVLTRTGNYRAFDPAQDRLA